VNADGNLDIRRQAVGELLGKLHHSILLLLRLSCYIKAREMGRIVECLAHIRGTRND
jgi:hypothetical protein